MRSALTALNAERELLDPGRPEIDLRGLVSDLLQGEVAPPTGDVARLIETGIDADAFYDKELSKSWDGLDENHRAARVEHVRPPDRLGEPRLVRVHVVHPQRHDERHVRGAA